jgi:hypothetical protein
MKLNSKWQLDLTLRNTHAGTRGIYFLIDFIIFFLLASFLYQNNKELHRLCYLSVCVQKTNCFVHVHRTSISPVVYTKTGQTLSTINKLKQYLACN